MPTSTKARLLQVATKLFAEQGYEKTTIDDVAAKLGVTGAALYRHVKSKEELFCRALDGCEENFKVRVVDEVKKVDDPVEKLRLLLGNGTLLWIEKPEMMLLLTHSRRHLSVNLRKKYSALDRENLKFMRRIIADVIDSCGVNDSLDPTLATFVMTGMSLWVARWYKPNGMARTEQLIDELTSMFLYGICGARPGGGAVGAERIPYDFSRRHSL